MVEIARSLAEQTIIPSTSPVTEMEALVRRASMNEVSKNYHPFYITSDRDGGFGQKSLHERSK